MKCVQFFFIMFDKSSLISYTNLPDIIISYSSLKPPFFMNSSFQFSTAAFSSSFFSLVTRGLKVLTVFSFTLGGPLVLELSLSIMWREYMSFCGLVGSSNSGSLLSVGFWKASSSVGFNGTAWRMSHTRRDRSWAFVWATGSCNVGNRIHFLLLYQLLIPIPHKVNNVIKFLRKKVN